MNHSYEKLLAESESRLNAALNEFEKASEDFRKTRCYSYFEFVKASAARLLDASDSHNALKLSSKDRN